MFDRRKQNIQVARMSPWDCVFTLDGDIWLLGCGVTLSPMAGGIHVTKTVPGNQRRVAYYTCDTTKWVLRLPMTSVMVRVILNWPGTHAAINT